MNRADLLNLLRDSCRAPSGDNAQPWRFRWDGTALSLYNISGIHNPHLDFEERGAYIAHGALIENLSIAAPHYGYKASFDLFPNEADPDLVAVFNFSPCEPRDDLLYPVINTRATNRHPYKSKTLTEKDLQAFIESVRAIPDIKLSLSVDRNTIKDLAHAASRAEIVILEDENIAAHFFASMVWTHKDEREKRTGFFVKTLEFNPIQHLVFWLASKTWIMRVFRTFGLPHFIASQDAKLYATGSMMGGVFLQDESQKLYISAGRALERLWLTAARKGLAFQPLIGMSFIAYRSETGRGTLTKRHAEEMHGSLIQAKKLLGNTEDILAFLFRTGDAPEPTARTSRRDPIIEFGE